MNHEIDSPDDWEDIVGNNESIKLGDLTLGQLRAMHEQGRGGEDVERLVARRVDVAELNWINHIPQTENPPRTRAEVIAAKRDQIAELHAAAAATQAEIAEKRSHIRNEVISALTEQLEQQRAKIAELEGDIEALERF